MKFSNKHFGPNFTKAALPKVSVKRPTGGYCKYVLYTNHLDAFASRKQYFPCNGNNINGIEFPAHY